MLHRDARMATWKARALTAAMRLMYKYKYDSDLLVVRDDVNTIGTRSQRGPVFHIDFPNSERYIRSTAYLLYTEWNNLPLELRNIEDYEYFRMMIKKHYKGSLQTSDGAEIISLE